MIESWMLVLGAGGIAGFFVGRWTAEVRRARYDGRRLWAQRKNYRL